MLCSKILKSEPHGQDRGEESLPDIKKGQWSEGMPIPLPDGRTDVIKIRFNDYAIDRSQLPVNGGGVLRLQGLQDLDILVAHRSTACKVRRVQSIKLLA